MIEVRDAAREEVPLVHQIMLDAFEEYRGKLNPPSGALVEPLEDAVASFDRGGAVLAFVDGVPVGSSRYERNEGFVYILRISVLPSHRGQGLAAAMLNGIHEIAKNLGYPEVRLSTREVMESNQRLYLREGYEIIGREQHPKGEGIVILFSKQLRNA